jgi:hypothetical protein
MKGVMLSEEKADIYISSGGHITDYIYIWIFL